MNEKIMFLARRFKFSKNVHIDYEYYKIWHMYHEFTRETKYIISDKIIYLIKRFKYSYIYSGNNYSTWLTYYEKRRNNTFE